jgi:hypothetical protein
MLSPSAAPAKPPAGWYGRAPSWPVLAAALLPLGVPLVQRGAVWVALGGALAAAGLVLSVCRRPAPVLRLAVALALAVLGYAPALTARLAGAGDGPVPAPRPSGDPFTSGPTLAGPRLRGRTGLLSLSSSQGPPERGLLAPLVLPPLVEPLPPAAPPESHLAARVAEALAAAVDPVTSDPGVGAALLLTRRGGLRHYSYPDFQLRGSYRLERPGYRAALDGPRGLLFVASYPDRAADREGVPPEGRYQRGANISRTRGDTRAAGDVQVYDVAALLRGGERPGADLRPVATFPEQGYVPNLVLSPDRNWLYYLGISAQAVTLYRLGVKDRAVATKLPLSTGAGTLALAPDGRVLYATTPAGVAAFDPTTLRQTREAPLPFVPNDLAADSAGRVFVGSRGERPVVVALDLRRPAPAVLGHYKAPFPGRLYLRLTPDGRHLFLGTSSVLADRLVALRVDGEGVRQPQVEGTFSTDDNGLVRGEFQLTPDGRFLLNRWGKVYRLPPGS